MISFRERIGHSFELHLISSSEYPTSFDLPSIQNYVKEKGTFLEAYRIVVSENQQEYHEGPFEFQLRLTEEMKKYQNYAMICISNGNTEEEFPFIREGDFLKGSFPHLSDYVLVGSGEMDNPGTLRNILSVILAVTIPIVLFIINRIIKLKSMK